MFRGEPIGSDRRKYLAARDRRRVQEGAILRLPRRAESSPELQLTDNNVRLHVLLIYAQPIVWQFIG